MCDYLPACVYVQPLCAWYTQRPEEGVGSLELDLWMVVIHYVGPLQEQYIS